MKTLDHSPRHRWDDRLGLAHGSVEQVVHGSASWKAAQTGQLSPDEYRADVAAQLRLQQVELAQLFADYFSGDQLDQALVSYVRQLRERGYRVALLSNDSIELTSKLVKLDLVDLFAPLVISAQIGVMKPDARAYETVLARLGCTAGEAVFIDDLPANVAGAESVGIHGMLYRDTPTLIPALEAVLASG